MSVYQFEKVYKNNIEALRSFALKLTRNEMDADDLVQETAIKAFRNFDSFKSGENFKNWSFTILKNTFITHYKRRKRRNVISTPIENLIGMSHNKPQVQSKTISENKLKYVEKAIEKLSVKSQEPFQMYISGYSYKEISDYLEIPTGTVKSRINFARTKIKQFYQEASDSNLVLSRVA